VALSPHVSNHEETVATLQFAERCKLLKNKVVKSKIRSTAELTALVESLSGELEALKKYNKLLEDALKAAGLPMPEAVAGSAAEAEKVAEAEVVAAQLVLEEAIAAEPRDNERVAHAEQAVAAAQAKQEAEEDKAEEASASNSVELAEMKFEFESLKQQHEVMTDDLAKAVSSAQESKSAFEESTATLQEQLKTLQQEVVELQGAKAGSESEVATAQHKLAQVEAGVEKTMGLLCTKSGRVKTLEKEAVAMRASLTEFEMRLEETEGDVVEQTRARADSRAVSITAKAEATESLAQVNSVCREQAATISQLQVEVAELQAATEQIDGAMQLERSRVEQLEKDVNDGSKLTEGYRKAFEAMVENEQVSEGDVINKTRQIAVLQAEIALLEIKVRWGEQRRSLSVMAQAGDCSLSGEIKHHFEVEVWHKSRLGSKSVREEPVEA